MFIRLVYRMKDESDAQVDTVGFPGMDDDGGWDSLTKILRRYLVFVTEKARPRAHGDSVLSYTTLMQYRQDLCFWALQQFKDRGKEGPSYATVCNSLTTTMRMLTIKYDIRTRRKTKDKTYLGLPELQQLIDMDMSDTPCIELAECHHLAWLVGRVTACRPGALGPPRAGRTYANVSGASSADELPWLTFSDITITRHNEEGRFYVKLRLRNLKCNPFEQAEKGGTLQKTVTFHINSPQEKVNLMLSVPHRILSLALRRGALRDYDTMEDLLSGNLHTIAFKPEVLSMPVLVAGKPRGLSVDYSAALTSDSMTEYLKTRGERLGYHSGISFYSIRRRAGTDIARIAGVEASRAIMCHEPDTRTLERFYLNAMPTTDVAAMGMNETTSAKSMDRMVLDSSELALTALPAARVAEIYGEVLNAAFRTVISKDETWLNLKREKDRKNRERVVRKQVLHCLMEQAHAEQQRSLSIQDRDDRKKAIVHRAFRFNDVLVRAVRIRDMAESTGATMDTVDEGVDFGADFAEPDPGLDPEPDVEDDTTADGDVTALDEDQGACPDYVEIMQEIPYKHAVRATMEQMANAGLSDTEKQSSKQLEPCPVCTTDDTIDQEAKDKLWTKHKLDRHLKSKVHSQLALFLRCLERDCTQEYGYRCPYCREIINGLEDPDNTGQSIRRYSRTCDVVKHVRSSSGLTIQGEPWSTIELAQLHETSKERFGWYSRDFEGDADHKEQQRQSRASAQQRVLFMANPQLAYSDDQVLSAPLDVPGRGDVVYGSWSDYATHEHVLNQRVLVETVHTAGQGQYATRDARLVPGGSIVVREFEMTDFDDAIRKASGVKRVALPGTPGGMIGQGGRIQDSFK